MDWWLDLKKWQQRTLAGVGAFVLIGSPGIFLDIFGSSDTFTEPAASATTTTTVPPAPTTTVPPALLPPFIFEASGIGDDVVDVDIPAGRAATVELMHDGTGNFTVTTFSASSDFLGLLVDEIGSYGGVRPIQFLPDEDVGPIVIRASGNWSIAIRPLNVARFVSCSSGSAAGTGDDVFIVLDFLDGAGSASLTHDGDGNFVIWSWGTTAVDAFDGTVLGRELLVDEIGPFVGTVPVGAGLLVWDTAADGHWTIIC